MTSQRFLWGLGLVLLAGSILGAGWFLNHTPGSDGEPRDNASSVVPPVVVAVGMVDVKEGVAQLYPVQTGRVVEVIEEGKLVEKDAVLLKLDSRLAHLRLREATADLEDRKKQLELAKLLPAQHKLKKEQQQAALDAVMHQRDATKNELIIKMEQAKLTGSTLNKSIEASYKDMVKKLDAMVRVEEAKLRELDLFDVQAKISIERAQADVDAKQAQVDQAGLAIKECSLLAPSDGLVLRVLVNRGEVLGLQPRQAAIQFAPLTPKKNRIVRAEILQEWASRVKVGQEVVIEDDTYASTQWKGTVTYLSPWFSEKRFRIPEPFFVNDVRTMECIVDITSENADALRIHQGVRVKIKQS